MKATLLGVLGAVGVACPVWAAPTDPIERATIAAERAAEAAERSAAAAERAAAALERANPTPVPIPMAPSPPPAAEPPPRAWTFIAGVGLIYLSGNANVITATANASTTYKSDKIIFRIVGGAAYGQNIPTPGGPTDVTALNAALSSQLYYRFTQKISAYIGGGVDTDHVKSVEVRGYGEIGMGVLWIDVKEGELQKILLNMDIGFRYQRENRFQYFPVLLDVPDVDLLAPRAAGAFRYALNKEVFFGQEIEVLPNILGESRVLVNSMTKVSAHVVSILSVSATFAVKYDSRPAAGRVPTDTALTLGFDGAL